MLMTESNRKTTEGNHNKTQCIDQLYKTSLQNKGKKIEETSRKLQATHKHKKRAHNLQITLK